LLFSYDNNSTLATYIDLCILMKRHWYYRQRSALVLLNVDFYLLTNVDWLAIILRLLVIIVIRDASVQLGRLLEHLEQYCIKYNLNLK
jgi:hypothetical protein